MAQGNSGAFLEKSC